MFGRSPLRRACDDSVCRTRLGELNPAAREDRHVHRLVNATAPQFSHPAVKDEPMPPHHPDAFVLIDHDHDGGSRQPKDVLFEADPASRSRGATADDC
jgi:hypothetical protein